MLALTHPDAAIAIRTLIALVFLGAAAGKMRHWTIFPGVVANYRLLPQFLVAPVTYALPPAEAAIGTAMLLDRFAPWSGAAAALLLTAFALAMAINLLRGRRHIDCGCFQGALKQPLRWILVSRNALLVALLGLALAAPPGRPGGWTVLTGLMAGCAMFLILQTLNALWSIVPPVARTKQPRVPMEGMS
jgi:Methylamine utilisation protein MauE